jgi:hypothetical protein
MEKIVKWLIAQTKDTLSVVRSTNLVSKLAGKDAASGCASITSKCTTTKEAFGFTIVGIELEILMKMELRGQKII